MCTNDTSKCVACKCNLTNSYYSLILLFSNCVNKLILPAWSYRRFSILKKFLSIKWWVSQDWYSRCPIIITKPYVYPLKINGRTVWERQFLFGKAEKIFWWCVLIHFHDLERFEKLLSLYFVKALFEFSVVLQHFHSGPGGKRVDFKCSSCDCPASRKGVLWKEATVTDARILEHSSIWLHIFDYHAF